MKAISKLTCFFLRVARVSSAHIVRMHGEQYTCFFWKRLIMEMGVNDRPKLLHCAMRGNEHLRLWTAASSCKSSTRLRHMCGSRPGWWSSLCLLVPIIPLLLRETAFVTSPPFVSI
ncbi:uncharacterized protein F5891DRAFT_1047357, partial [Suillus fuscotomentosus]